MSGASTWSLVGWESTPILSGPTTTTGGWSPIRAASYPENMVRRAQVRSRRSRRFGRFQPINADSPRSCQLRRLGAIDASHFRGEVVPESGSRRPDDELDAINGLERVPEISARRTVRLDHPAR